MDPILQLQDDATEKLNCESFFASVPVVSFRKTIIAQEIAKLSPHLIGKNGKQGVGVIVGMPTITGIDPNVSTPQGEIFLPIDIIEQGELNMTVSNGTRLNAEQVALAVRRALHHFAIEGLGCLYQDTKAIEPLAGLDKDYPGCVGYRVNLKARLQESSSLKVVSPTIAFNSGTGIATLTTPTAGATIYYVDYDPTGSIPASTFPGPVNPDASIYAAPFASQVGRVVRFAAYKDGYAGSNAGQSTLTPD